MLKPRLEAICTQIQNANYVVDVGSDHAFLSIELIKQNRAKFVSNIEINQLPLTNGLNNVKKLNLANQIDFYLNDGLRGLDLKKEIDYLCISGMGADNIIKIISENELNKINRFILQPNSNSYKLRQYLFYKRYSFINELIIFDNGKYYEILVVDAVQKNNNIFSDLDIYLGPILKQYNNQIVREFLFERYDFLKTIKNEKNSLDLKKEFLTIEKFLYDKKWIN